MFKKMTCKNQKGNLIIIIFTLLTLSLIIIGLSLISIYYMLKGTVSLNEFCFDDTFCSTESYLVCHEFKCKLKSSTVTISSSTIYQNKTNNTIIHSTSSFHTTQSTTTLNNLQFNSIVLDTFEKNNLLDMLPNLNLIKNLTLLYRGTQHGFYTSMFHKNCDNKSPTITIIYSHLNYIFGGYTNESWSSFSSWKNDTTAFLFRLRVNGTLSNDKFNIVNSEFAINNFYLYGPRFGNGFDIFIRNNSNVNFDSYSNFCNAYQCPLGITSNTTNARNYLAGSFYFQTKEIEIFQLFY